MSIMLAAVLLSANPAVQQAPAAAPAAQPQAAKPKKEKKICKVEDDDTGSRMVKRTCLTEEEWDARVNGRTADQIGTLPTSH